MRHPIENVSKRVALVFSGGGSAGRTGAHLGAVRRRRGGRQRAPCAVDVAACAVDEPVILLHPALPSVGVSIVMERERQQNDSLIRGYRRRTDRRRPGSCRSLAEKSSTAPEDSRTHDDL